jgi:hypothetical protein
MKWPAIICGIVGGGIPFLLGSYLVAEQMVYRALHPTPPGMGACGNPMAVALLVIAGGTPLGAGVFAAIGWVVGGRVALCQRRLVEPSGELTPARAVVHPRDDNPYRSPRGEPEELAGQGNPDAGRSGEILRRALILLVVTLFVLALVWAAEFNA